MNRPDVQAGLRVDDAGRDAARAAAERGRHGSSGSYLGYLLCAAGRPDLLTIRHLHARLPPDMPPMC
jgi:hypothetical protein